MLEHRLPAHDCDRPNCPRIPPGYCQRRLSMLWGTFCSFECLVWAVEVGIVNPAKFVGKPLACQLRGDLPS